MCVELNLNINNIQKMCRFFVLPGNGQALLDMPDVDMLNIIKITCNTIGTHGNYSMPITAVQTQPPTRVQTCEQTLHKHEAGCGQG